MMLRAARLPFVDRVVPAALAGKSSALITDLNRTGTRQLADTQRSGEQTR
jgi:hypothetical protein